MPDFLLEIGLEEVPARMIAGAEAELLKRTLALLTREQLIDATAVAKSYSTPRRLAVLVEGVKEQQSDITEETTGPALKIAFKDGVPTPAAEAFAKKSGVAVADLKTVSTPKGEYLAATTVKKGRSAAEGDRGALLGEEHALDSGQQRKVCAPGAVAGVPARRRGRPRTLRRQDRRPRQLWPPRAQLRRGV
jgi:hypothetical protein